jgi:hypothetical protein
VYKLIGIKEIRQTQLDVCYYVLVYSFILTERQHVSTLSCMYVCMCAFVCVCVWGEVGPCVFWAVCVELLCHIRYCVKCVYDTVFFDIFIAIHVQFK